MVSKVLVEDTSLIAIGNALREKLGEAKIEQQPVITQQGVQHIFKTKNAIGFKTASNGEKPETSLYQTYYFPGASTIVIQTSAYTFGYPDSTLLTWADTYENKTNTYSWKDYSSSSSPPIKTYTYNSDIVSVEWTNTSGSSSNLCYMTITPYDINGEQLQEDIEIMVPVEVRNEYKPAEMSEAISSLAPKEELVITNIYYSSPTYEAGLDLSNYVKDYNNIRRIVWSSSSSGSTAIYDHELYLRNLEAGVVNPHRIMLYGKSSSGYTMDSLTDGSPASTRYYYFNESEWNNSGILQLYMDTNGDGNADSDVSYERYGRYVYLVYKKEDE